MDIARMYRLRTCKQYSNQKAFQFLSDDNRMYDVECLSRHTNNNHANACSNPLVLCVPHDRLWSIPKCSEQKDI